MLGRGQPLAQRRAGMAALLAGQDQRHDPLAQVREGVDDRVNGRLDPRLYPAIVAAGDRTMPDGGPLLCTHPNIDLDRAVT